MSPGTAYSFLDLVKRCDNFQVTRRNPDAANLRPWRLNTSPGSPVLGLLSDDVSDLLLKDDEALHAFGASNNWTHTKNSVCFAEHLDTPAKRSVSMAQMLKRWHDQGYYAGIIGPKKWRDELYPVYANPFGAKAKENPNFLFEFERAACALFGIVTYGVHMSIYHEDDDGVKLWVPKRANTKSMWPGWLDNSVAGGIPSGMQPFESLVKEAMEEASIEEDLVRKYAKSVGCISYYFRTDKGWLQPEVEYVYDMKIPKGVDFQPKPLDGEVESFKLLPMSEVIALMRQGEFKPNCALVIIDFMIRIGYLTPDNEPDFLDIITRLHGRFDYDRWSLE